MIRRLVGTWALLVLVPWTAGPVGSLRHASSTSGPFRFDPAAVSFVSTSRGWALGRAGCFDCARLRTTWDGGRHWVALPPPGVSLSYDTPAGRRGVADLAFADGANGFLFGPALLVTHDGGRSWKRQPLPAVQTLAIGAGHGYALTQDQKHVIRLWRTAIGSDRWQELTLPTAVKPLPSSATGTIGLTVEGATLVLLQTGYTGPTGARVSRSMLGRLWVSRDSGARWRSRPVPCTGVDGGAALLGIARAHAAEWLIDCFSNEQSSQEQHTRHRLYRTTDAGVSWVRLADPTRSNLPVLLADNGAAHAFLATEGVRDALVGTFDGGRHWRRLLSSGGTFFGWADLRFLTAATGFVVGPTHYAPEHVYRTDDGGRTWRRLRVA